MGHNDPRLGQQLAVEADLNSKTYSLQTINALKYDLISNACIIFLSVLFKRENQTREHCNIYNLLVTIKICWSTSIVLVKTKYISGLASKEAWSFQLGKDISYTQTVL